MLPRDTIAFALWPDEDEEAARANLRRNLNLLRGVLPDRIAGWIGSDGASIEFRHADADTDVAAFEADAACPDGLHRAAAAYGGDFAGRLDEPWVLSERERLRARYHGVLTALVGIEFSARRFDDALMYARRIFSDEPLREDIARRIMSIRYAMGDRPGALLEFERFARNLRTEMNIDPMPETVGLRDLVLRGDPLPFAPDASYASAPRSPAGASPLLPFTGRRTVLGRLTAAWQSASGGDGTTVFIGGEAGIGKTRTVAEFLERVVGLSARIIRGTTAGPEARPYEALLGAFSQAAPFVPTLDLEPVWLAALALLVPEIGARCPAIPPRATLPPEREVTRLFESFARFAGALARARPIVIVLEDLHWSGPATFEAVRYLAARLHGYRILLVATYRDGESPAVEALVGDLRASRHADVIPLSRLEPQQTREMLALADPPITGPDAAELVGRSEGHPLFLTELLRDYPTTRGGVAGGIVELVEARLARCSADAQTLARIAALCGATFDLDVLQAVVGWDDGTLVDRLAELLQRQFIRSTASHERGSYAFSHALVRGAVSGAADGAEARRIHRIVARALEARAAGARYDIEIAQHWALADEPQRAANAYLRAAQQSIAVQARDEAANLATHGLELSLDPRTQRNLLRARIDANLRRAPAAMLRADAERLGQIAARLDDADTRYEAALLRVRIEAVNGDVESHRAAIALLRVFADAALPLQCAEIAEAEANNARMRGEFATALEHAGEALRGYAASGLTRDELRVAILAASIQTRLGLLAETSAQLAAIEPRIAALDDPALAMDYWYTRTSLSHAQRDAPATRAAADILRGLARAAGDRLMEGHAAIMRATAYQHASALSRALIELDVADEIYRSIGADRPRQSVRNNRASVLLQVGRLAEAGELLRAEYVEVKRGGAAESVYFAASNLGCALLMQGCVDEAVGLGREALELARAMGSEGFAALALGDLGEAEVVAGRPAAGLAHLVEAAAINRHLQRPAVLAHDLARAALAESVSARSAVHARGALAIVEADPEHIALAPEILNRCGLAFERAGDRAAAAYCRRRGNGVLAERIATMEGTDREFYLALPWHASLAALGVGPADRLRRLIRRPATKVQETSPSLR
jgi:predicted ATPase/DNA-binding SARP family transcriptional activator